MSAQNEHAAVVVLESAHVATVNTAGARSLTNDATLENVSGQGNAVRYSINGTFTSLAGWINAIAQLKQAPFADNVALKVIATLASFVEAYSGLMLALTDKYDVLTSKTSPVDGKIIGQEIAVFQFAVAVYFDWLARFVPTQLAKLTELGNQAYAAYEKAAAKYPSEGKGSVSLKNTSNLGISLDIPQPTK
ncbi:hypothetical protein FB107DRAFT_272230 [Schizophyllum commune]